MKVYITNIKQSGDDFTQIEIAIENCLDAVVVTRSTKRAAILTAATIIKALEADTEIVSLRN